MLYKIIFVGDEGAGKTCISNILQNKEFVQTFNTHACSSVKLD